MRRGLSSVAVLLASAVGCSQAVDQHASPPTRGQYQLTFPSTAVAVATETVEVFVYDATAPGADCLSLALARASGVPTPASPVLLLDTGALPTCSLTTGQGELAVPFGSRSIFAVAQRGGQDFFTGCAQVELSEASGLVNVSLAQAKGGTSVPATKCTSLSQSCASGC